MVDDPDGDAGDPAQDALLAELRAVAAQVDPLPDTVLEAARATFTWRTIDAELAALAYDSALDERPLAGVRGAATARSLTYELDDLVVEVEVDGGVVGQLVPPQPAAVRLRSGAAVAEAVADEVGRFRFADVPSGPACLEVDLADGRTVRTDWTPL